MRILALLLTALFVTLSVGCRTVLIAPITPHVRISHTVDIFPPHAPRHGYRHHHHDYDLEYDNGFGAYIVLGYDGYYFYNNHYIRYYDGYWHESDRLNGRWRRAEHSHVPRKLRGHKRYKRRGPPPHAPAHGSRHRHNQHNVDMVFDSGIGAYIVLGFDNLFFFDNHYMRFYDGRWHESDRHNGKWYRAKDRRVPHKLRKARKHEKNGLYKRVKKQHKNEHKKRGKHDKRRKNHDDDDRRDRRGNGHRN